MMKYMPPGVEFLHRALVPPTLVQGSLVCRIGLMMRMDWLVGKDSTVPWVNVTVVLVLPNLVK